MSNLLILSQLIIKICLFEIRKSILFSVLKHKVTLDSIKKKKISAQILFDCQTLISKVTNLLHEQEKK